jgi:hypothetical protein
MLNSGRARSVLLARTFLNDYLARRQISHGITPPGGSLREMLKMEREAAIPTSSRAVQRNLATQDNAEKTVSHMRRGM